MANFQVGDVVKLKSGGPAMTINDIADYSMDENGLLSASCAWFDGVKPMSQVFPLHSLIKAD